MTEKIDNIKADKSNTEDNPSRPNKIITLLEDVCVGYAQVFFSSKWYVGLLFLIATFINPLQGIAGLAALTLSNLWALWFGFPEKYIKQGFFAYNGLLIGLALGLFFQVNLPFCIMLTIATLLGVLIAASLRYIYERYLFIPVLSMPFVLTTWIVIAASREFQGIFYSTDTYALTNIWDVFPDSFDIFFHSLGAAFFQISTFSGILIALGIFIFSRFAFMLSILGLAAGSIIYTLLQGSPQELTTGLIGFNFVLTAIAVGGIWTVLGLDSIFLAIAGGAICAFTSSAMGFLLRPLGIPPLAFPFVVTTSIIIYALKHRSVVSRFKTVDLPEDTPEKNIKQNRNTRARLLTGEIPVFDLPVSGEWCITQGFSGQHTHKDLWAHAWDFEVFDEDGVNYRGNGSIVEDYYAYNMPVFPPTQGKVVTVVNHIDDNPVGQIDAENNWGNAIVIWHYGSIYTALCHLRKGSITVNEGDVLRRGQLIGKVGNSGRSPFPHLHFQVQTNHEIGAPTIDSELLHYVINPNGKKVYFTHGRPVEGDRIAPLQAESVLFDTVSFPTGRTWDFWIRSDGREWRETWESDIDFVGNRFLLCRKQKARLKYFVNRKVFLLLDYDGPRDIGLYWFFMSVSRIPMTSESVHWQEELPAEMTLALPARLLFDLVEPIYLPAKLSTASRLVRNGTRLSIETDLTTTGPLAPRKYRQVQTAAGFELYRGLLSLRVKIDGRNIFELYTRGPGSPAKKEAFAAELKNGNEKA